MNFKVADFDSVKATSISRVARAQLAQYVQIKDSLNKKKIYNENLIEDLVRLRDELKLKGFNEDDSVKNSNFAEAVFKINSCLYKGYPRKS